MTKKMHKAAKATKEIEYRVFNLPGYGRVRAPASMTQEGLLAAIMQEDDADPHVATSSKA